MTDYLLDTNIILRVVQSSAPTHTLAVEAVTSILAKGDNIFVTPQILIEFWAVATRPVAVNGLGWSSTLAEAEIQQLHLQFPMLSDRSDVFSAWLQLVKKHEVQGKKVHDARLVAVMLIYNISHLLTFNVSDFQRFEGITAIHPSEV